MARRSDPRRIADAHRAGTRARLISAGLVPERVDELLAAYDVLPERQGQPFNAEDAYRFVLERRR